MDVSVWFGIVGFANRRFRKSPLMSMGSGSAWAQLSIPQSAADEPPDKFYVAQSDVKNFFYALGISDDLSDFFCLPPVPVSFLRTLPGFVSSVCVGNMIWPALRVFPMGWNWAFWFAQRVHQHIALEAPGLSSSRLIRDVHPAPSLDDGEPAILPYADNLNVAGTDPVRVN
jgi:hypothetical protein